MAARTAAFEFSEKINGCEWRGRRRRGGFLVGQRLFGREICFDTENERPKNGLCCWKRMTNGVCIVNASNRKKVKAGGKGQLGVVNEMIFANKN
jgi:hypothetical protein